MNWRTKARIQTLVARLPEGVSNSIYYRLQRRFGGLRSINPVQRLKAGIETWRRIQAQGHDPRGAVFFEVGTGRALNVPLSYWLMGAEKTITIDKNRYLREELVLESISYICHHENAIRNLFGDLLVEDRMMTLLQGSWGTDVTLQSALQAFNIEYISPGDAVATELPDSCIDYHTSYTVFEHIPEIVLVGILNESNRIVKPGGLGVHCIDYSDHFAHSDKSLPKVHFLQFEDEQWDKIAGNRYMYMNRLRHDDYLALFEQSGQAVLSTEPATDPESLELLNTGGIRPASRFAQKPAETLAVTSAWIVSKIT